jgi:hypothetical protein
VKTFALRFDKYTNDGPLFLAEVWEVREGSAHYLAPANEWSPTHSFSGDVVWHMENIDPGISYPTLYADTGDRFVEAESLEELKGMYVEYFL